MEQRPHLLTLSVLVLFLLTAVSMVSCSVLPKLRAGAEVVTAVNSPDTRHSTEVVTGDDSLSFIFQGAGVGGGILGGVVFLLARAYFRQRNNTTKEALEEVCRVIEKSAQCAKLNVGGYDRSTIKMIKERIATRTKDTEIGDLIHTAAQNVSTFVSPKL